MEEDSGTVFWPFSFFRFGCKVKFDPECPNVASVGKVHITAMRHTAGFQQYGAFLLPDDDVLNGETVGCYGVKPSRLAFSTALSMSLRYFLFSSVAPWAHTSLRCLS